MTFASDLRYSLRSYIRAPGLTATLVLTIALGVGGNAAVFGFIGGLISQDIGSADPEAAARFARVAALLVGASALILFLASSTVAGLLLARARTRAPETAVRVALGASQLQLARLSLADGLVVATLGGILGALMALWTSDLFPLLFFAEDAEQLAMTPDPQWLLGAAAVWFVVLLVSALSPVFTTSRRAPWSILRRESSGVSDSSSKSRRHLVIAQVGVCSVLLIVASIIGEDLRSTLRTARGQAVGSLLIAQVEFSGNASYLNEVEARVRELREVSGTAWVATPPAGRAPSQPFTIELPQPRTREIRLDVLTLVPEQLEATDLVPVAGRSFTVQDGLSSCRVALLNTSAADRYFDGDAVGRAVERSDGQLLQIVGVLPSNGGDDARPALYYDANQEPGVRGRADEAFYALPETSRPTVDLDINVASSSYFDVLADPPIEGRRFRPSDDPGACRVGLISEDGAQTLFGGNAVGGTVVGVDGGRIEVVGVVQAAPLGAAQRTRAAMLTLPLGQAYESRMTLAVRVREVTDEVRQTLTTTVRSVSGGALLARVSTLEEHLVRTSLAPERVATTLIGVSAAIALLLAIVGVHGGMAELVARRRRELALRIALGAQALRLVGYVVRAGLVLAALGAGAGLIVALAASPLLRLVVRYPNLPSATTLSVAGLAIGALVAIACAVPAWRAVSVDPRDAMGADT